MNYVKRIQSKIKRQGGQASSQQIRVRYEELVKNPTQPTCEEIDQVVKSLLGNPGQTSGAISPVNSPELNQFPNPGAIGPVNSPELNQFPNPGAIGPVNSPELNQFPNPGAISPVNSPELNQFPNPGAIGPVNSPELNQFPSPGAIGPVNSPELNQFPSPGAISPVNSQGVVPVSIDTSKALNMAIHQIGIQGNQEAIGILTSLANELVADISDIEEMVSVLVSGYLNKRQSVLASAIGTLQSLRRAQTEQIQSGLDNDFFNQKNSQKQQFLRQIGNMFSN